MKLANRVVGVLALSPMTNRDLARALTASERCVSRITRTLRMEKKLRIVGTTMAERTGRPRYLWGVRA